MFLWKLTVRIMCLYKSETSTEGSKSISELQKKEKQGMKWWDWRVNGEDPQLLLSVSDSAPLSPSHPQKAWIALPLRALFYLLTCPGRISHLGTLHNRASSQSSCVTAQLASLPLREVITTLSPLGPHFLLLLPAGWVGRVDCMCFKLIPLQLFPEHCYPGEHRAAHLWLWSLWAIVLYIFK